MKKLTLITMFFVLFLGTRSQAQDAKTAFFGKHECHAIDGSHAQRCKLGWGDTLSRFARAAYGHGNLYSPIKDANPEIVDANKIQAYTWIIVPDSPTAEAASTSTPATPAAAPTTPREQSQTVTAPVPEQVGTTEAAKSVVAPAEQNDSTIKKDVPAVEPASTSTPATPAAESPVTATAAATLPPPPPLPIEKKAAKGKRVKITGYQFVVSGSMQGQLQTQLLLFNSEEEKNLSLPSERIDLKPSLAVPAKNGTSIVSVRLKKLPAQPFELLVGGIDDPVLSTQIRPYSGKTPGGNSFLRTLGTIGKVGVQGGVSFAVTGNPFIAAGVVAGPRIVRLVIAQREKSQERKLTAAQVAVDKSKLALYRASLEESGMLSSSKEIVR